jgi:hypothetical protein
MSYPDRQIAPKPAPSQKCNFSIASASTVSGLFNSLFIQANVYALAALHDTRSMQSAGVAPVKDHP